MDGERLLATQACSSPCAAQHDPLLREQSDPTPGAGTQSSPACRSAGQYARRERGSLWCGVSVWRRAGGCCLMPVPTKTCGSCSCVRTSTRRDGERNLIFSTAALV
eukprot:7015633-Prymnesium_polylepis.2